MDEHEYHFAGDPAVDSPRRHLERVLSENAAERPGPKWRWIAGLLAGGGSWTLWRFLRRRREGRTRD